MNNNVLADAEACHGLQEKYYKYNLRYLQTKKDRMGHTLHLK